jgi:membrane-associated phospholipid phosphatase
VGIDQIAAGIFPNVHDYFLQMREALPTPGNPDGIFYQMVVDAHAAGERPTAAFPSSHVGVSTILMLLAWQTKNRRFFWILMFFYVLLCLSTVYIYAHYAIDVIGGWLSALLLFPMLHFIYTRLAKE